MKAEAKEIEDAGKERTKGRISQDRFPLCVNKALVWDKLRLDQKEELSKQIERNEENVFIIEIKETKSVKERESFVKTLSQNQQLLPTWSDHAFPVSIHNHIKQGRHDHRKFENDLEDGGPCDRGEAKLGIHRHAQTDCLAWRDISFRSCNDPWIFVGISNWMPNPIKFIRHWREPAMQERWRAMNCHLRNNADNIERKMQTAEQDWTSSDKKKNKEITTRCAEMKKKEKNCYFCLPLPLCEQLLSSKSFPILFPQSHHQDSEDRVAATALQRFSEKRQLMNMKQRKEKEGKLESKPEAKFHQSAIPIQINWQLCLSWCRFLITCLIDKSAGEIKIERETSEKRFSL